MSDNAELYGFGEDFVEAAPAPTDAELRTVSTLVSRLAQLQAEKDRLETDLKATNKTLQQLAEVDLPEALIAAGHTCPSKETISGHRIEFIEKFRCGQLSDANPEGIAWLEQNEHGDLIKHAIAVTLPRDSEQTAAEIETFLRNHRAANTYKLTVANTVHPQTLAAFAREQCESGVDVPLATLNVHRVRSVKVVS